MQDPRPETRRAAIRAWKEMGIDLASGAVGDLIKALEDEEAAVRLEALSALAWLGPEAEAAVPPLLEKMTADPDESIRDAATRALLKIDEEGRRTLPYLEATRGELKREGLLKSLRRIGPEARSLRVRLQAAWGEGRGLNPPHPDGPEPPDKFWWRHRAFDIKPTACKLLDRLWGKDRVAIAEVALLVWGTNDPTTDQVKSALREINSVLGQAGVNFCYSTKAGYFVKQ
jgi:hypothetical protein